MGATAAGEAGAESHGEVASSDRVLLPEEAKKMAAAIEVTNKGLRQGELGAPGGGVEEAAEKRAIADVFRKVDLDSSGHVSEEELLEGVSAFSLCQANQMVWCLPCLLSSFGGARFCFLEFRWLLRSDRQSVSSLDAATTTAGCTPRR